MKNIILFLCGLIVMACKTGSVSEIPVIPADSVAQYIGKYTGKKVAVEGKIIHVCPVRGQKMKLLGANRQVIKIIPPDPRGKLDFSWNGKQVRVEGTVSEIRLPRSYVDSIEKAGALLCHIDHTPCIDTAWVASKHRQGVAAQISQKNVISLRQEMQHTGHNYVSVILLTADRVKETEIVTEKTADAGDLPSACQGCPLCGLCMKTKDA